MGPWIRHPFNADGLPPEDMNSPLSGNPFGTGPDTERILRRRQLVDNLEILVKQLWKVGITEIFIDGSFVEDKDRPNDIDGYFVCDFVHLTSGLLQNQLNTLDPHQIWTWDPESRVPVPGFDKHQLPMWCQYRVEMYPHWGNGPFSGIRDQYGNDLEFPAAFRISRNEFKPHGIVKIVRTA